MVTPLKLSCSSRRAKLINRVISDCDTSGRGVGWHGDDTQRRQSAGSMPSEVLARSVT